MSKRIVVLSDGTGNAAANLWRTNVWRTFESLDLTESTQVAAYDDGVGTSSFKPMAIVGGAFGWGLKRNVLHLYKFLCRNYSVNGEDGPDKIYGFGFSRGAFTIRVLSGLVLNQGLIDARTSEAELSRLAKCAYRAYRAERYKSFLGLEKPFRSLRDGFIQLTDRLRKRTTYAKQKNIQVEEIRFLGLWDTVAAYGLPIDEMSRGVSRWLWPLELPDRQLSERVTRACHALALDDERTTFHPILWNESEIDQEKSAKAANTGEERISQVWFPGVHSNIGGGYPDDRLASISLYWMMQEAQACGLLFKSPPKADSDALLRAHSGADKDGRLYDSRKGLGGYYRYGPRKIADLCNTPLKKTDPDFVSIQMPKIHASALQRMRGDNIYAPFGLPEKYMVVDEKGIIHRPDANDFESASQATARVRAQEGVWNIVWIRRVSYFLTLAASFHLAMFPLIHETRKADEFETPVRLVSETIRFASTFLPHLASFWTNAFAARPLTFLLGLAFLIGFMVWSMKLAGNITDRMRAIWFRGETAAPEPSGFIFHLRSNRYYQKLVRNLKRKIVPALSAIVVVYLFAGIVSHLLFNVEDSFGRFCKPSKEEPLQAIKASGEVTAKTEFRTNSICWARGIKIEEGVRYAFELKRTAEWKDASIATDLGGFESSELPDIGQRFFMSAVVPFRRVILRPWFLPILRIGEVGSDEYFVDPPASISITDIKLHTAGVFRARRSGELFIYVNDAGIAIPGLHNAFYKNNLGAAIFKIKVAPRQ